MSEKGKYRFSAQVFGESLESPPGTSFTRSMPVETEEGLVDTSKTKTKENVAEDTYFTPHPPEEPKDCLPRSPQRKNRRRFGRRLNRVDSNSLSSEDERLVSRLKTLESSRTTGSKLPPLATESSRELEHKPHIQSIDKYIDNISATKASRNPLTLTLKPLSPIKDGRKVADNFIAKQFLERKKDEVREKGPIKPLNPLKESSDSTSPNTNNDDDFEDTLTSVSSDDSSNSELSPVSDLTVSKTQFYPKAPDSPPNHQRHSLSLNSVRDNSELVERHSDTEAIRRDRVQRQSARNLWGKARVVTLLPKVPASRARDRNSNFVKEELDKYLPEKTLMVFIGTWNMHGEKQLPIFVDDFLLPECCQFMQDLYVIGSQESTPSRKEWEIKLQEALGPSHVLIYSCTFGVLHLAMYLRRELVWFCSAVEQATVATRPGHMIKTKGAIGLSLSIFGTSFLFINSHFTAHEQKWKERIGDYRLIRKTLSLPLNFSETANHETDVTSRFDQVFWLGDFNFRVEEHHGVVEKFLRQCEEDADPNYDELVEKDQMTKLMKKDGVFEHFEEAKINFPPTYRFEINPDDPGCYSSIRVPSWTDRIVYRSAKENSVSALYYDCCTTLNISDHRPVYGIFEASMKPIKDRISFTGVHFVRDVYIEANRRRVAPPRNHRQTTVSTFFQMLTYIKLMARETTG